PQLVLRRRAVAPALGDRLRPRHATLRSLRPGVRQQRNDPPARRRGVTSSGPPLPLGRGGTPRGRSIVWRAGGRQPPDERERRGRSPFIRGLTPPLAKATRTPCACPSPRSISPTGEGSNAATRQLPGRT